MPDLCSRFNTLLAGCGVEQANYRSEKLKHRLRECFKAKIVFHQPAGVCQPCIVHGANMTVGQVAQQLSQIEQSDSSSDETLSSK